MMPTPMKRKSEKESDKLTNLPKFAQSFAGVYARLTLFLFSKIICSSHRAPPRQCKLSVNRKRVTTRQRTHARGRFPFDWHLIHMETARLQVSEVQRQKRRSCLWAVGSSTDRISHNSGGA